jgi:NTP pyrophosphatase (non-canonical NTP hydrolase)
VMKKSDRDQMVSEMADVFAWVCSLANLLEIDLSQALTSKYGNDCSRCHSAPCKCKDAL